jgi:transcriptional regulator with XRE-family HTH domain
MNVGSIGEYIRQQREQAKISLRQLASTAGVSNPYLSQIERGLRRPSAEILQQIAKGLRISAEALYVQAGILEDREPDSGVRAAVLAAPDLTERQKQVLLEIYESFRQETSVSAEVIAVTGRVASRNAAAHSEGKPAASGPGSSDGMEPGAAGGGARDGAGSQASSARARGNAASPGAVAPDGTGSGVPAKAKSRASGARSGRARTVPRTGARGNAGAEPGSAR